MARTRLKDQTCKNCGFQFRVAPEYNNYCPNCGQENHNPRQPLVHYIKELLESLFHLDSKTWITLRTLIFQPGQITVDYLSNRRARYTPPIRLFVFTLALFILCLELTTREYVKQQVQHREGIPLSQRINQLPDTARISFSDAFFMGRKNYFPVSFLRELKEADPAQMGTWLRARGLPSGYIQRMYFRFIGQDIRSNESQLQFLQKITRVHYWVIVMILPLAAFWVFLFFRHRGMLYYDALILCLHFFSFSQLMGCLLGLAGYLLFRLAYPFDTSVLFFYILISSFLVNMLPGFKRIFGLSWVSTVIRASGVMVFHLSAYILLFWLIVGYRLLA